MTRQYKREPRNFHRGSRLRRKKYRINWRRFLPTLLLLVLFLYGAVNLLQYALRSAATKRTNAQLQLLYEEAMETAAPESTPSPTPEPTAAPEPALLSAYQYIGDTLLPQTAEMLEKNSDTVA